MKRRPRGVDDVREAERDEFRQFVVACGAGLFRVAMALAGGHHAAEDLLQGSLARTYAR
jgi:DNA-directed RNA polymerase specialized sigma24 family protein